MRASGSGRWMMTCRGRAVGPNNAGISARLFIFVHIVPWLRFIQRMQLRISAHASLAPRYHAATRSPPLSTLF